MIHYFSKKSNQYDEYEVIKWTEIIKNKYIEITEGTLYYYSKKSNEKEYIEIINQHKLNYVEDKEEDELINNYINNNEKIELIKEKILTTYDYQRDEKQWYIFIYHKWEKVTENYIESQINEDKNKYFKTKGITNREVYNRLPNYIMNDIKKYYENKNITNKKKYNTNTHLVCFKNGVYDLDKEEFREGRSNDNITISTNNNYKEYKNNEELTKIIETIIPDKEVREYMLKYLSYCLSGRTNEKKFTIWQGKGNDGKTTLSNLCQSAFGEYSGLLNIETILSERQNSNQANPSIMMIKDCRIVFYNEPKGTETINVGYMKELTGGYNLISRQLYSILEKFKPQFKLFMLCNSIPNIYDNTDGTWNRIIIVPFTTRFISNPKRINEYKEDKSMNEKIQNYGEDFISFLIEKYKEYKREELKVPSKIKE